MPNSGGANVILKTIIFVNDIENIQCIVAYLYFRLPFRLQDKQPEIIHTFSSNLQATIQTNFFEDFQIGNMLILIYIKYADIGLNLRDILCMIQ